MPKNNNPQFRPRPETKVNATDNVLTKSDVTTNSNKIIEDELENYYNELDLSGDESAKSDDEPAKSDDEPVKSDDESAKSDDNEGSEISLDDLVNSLN